MYIEIKCKKRDLCLFVPDSKTFLALQKIYENDVTKALLIKKITVKPLKLELKIYTVMHDLRNSLLPLTWTEIHILIRE